MRLNSCTEAERVSFGCAVRKGKGRTYGSDTSVISEHQAANTMPHGHVRAFLCQRDLNASWAPRDERREAALADAQQALMHVGGVDFALDDVEDGDVAALLPRYRRDHPVLRLQQSPHDVQYGCLPHRLGLLNLVTSKRRIRGHEEVASGCWNEGGQNADEVVMHVARVSKCCRACRHDC